jgi:hypothetical protein
VQYSLGHALQHAPQSDARVLLPQPELVAVTITAMIRLQQVACLQVVGELEARCTELSAAAAQSQATAAAAKAAASEAVRLHKSAEARLVCRLRWPLAQMAAFMHDRLAMRQAQAFPTPHHQNAGMACRLLTVHGRVCAYHGTGKAGAAGEGLEQGA